MNIEKTTNEFMEHLKKKLGMVVQMVPPKYIKIIHDEVEAMIGVAYNEGKEDGILEGFKKGTEK